MSEAPEADEAQPDHVTALLDGTRDWLLSDLITVFAQNGMEMDITLNIGGTLVSGTLISGKTYFNEMADGFVKAPGLSTETVQVMDKYWRGWADIYDKPEDAGEDWEPGPASYVHLRNTRCFNGGDSPIPVNRGPLWRGRLSSIDGFWLGSLSSD